jgi:DNA polymerase-3 subunit beta
MKVTFAKDAILGGLQKVLSVISTRTTHPVLKNILFRAEKDHLLLTATDLDITVRTKVPAEVSKGGATTLPARQISLVFKEVIGAEIQMEVDSENVASIRAGSSFFKLKGISEEDFPVPPKLEGGKTYSVSEGLLADMLKHTVYAASRDESRYILNGVLLSFKNGKLAAVASDGRRMALYESELEFPKDGEGDYVLPLKAVDELVKTLGDEGVAKVVAMPNQVAFEFKDVLLITKLVEGTYPNFRQVIPSQSAERIKLEREALLGAIKRAALVAMEQTNSVKLNFSKNKLEVTAVAPNVGEAQETVAIAYNGKPLSVAFNPEYLMDPLRVLVQDEVYIELTDELNPGLIKADIPFLYVIMPMRSS